MSIKKKIILVFIAVIIVFIFLWLNSKFKEAKSDKIIGKSSNIQHSAEKNKLSGKEAKNKTYACPDHPAAISSTSGKCPRCGKEMMEVEE